MFDFAHDCCWTDARSEIKVCAFMQLSLKRASRILLPPVTQSFALCVELIKYTCAQKQSHKHEGIMPVTNDLLLTIQKHNLNTPPNMEHHSTHVSMGVVIKNVYLEFQTGPLSPPPRVGPPLLSSPLASNTSVDNVLLSYAMLKLTCWSSGCGGSWHVLVCFCVSVCLSLHAEQWLSVTCLVFVVC